jgi:arylsulfatase
MKLWSDKYDFKGGIMTGRKMKRREFLRAAGMGAAAFSAGGVLGLSACSTGRKLPNIVLIFIDDLGYGDLGCFGAEGWKTPHIDRLAEEGIKFTDFYASQAVCSASRASLLTGCYAERVSILGALGPAARHGIHENEMTIAEMLKEKGYTAAIYGKWHLGHHKRFLPLQHGFDDYLGLPYSNDMWPVDYDGRMLTPEHPGPRPWKLKYPQLPLVDGNETVQEIRTLEDQATLTTRYTERAVRFIEKNRNRPFFLYMPHSMVHVPLGVSDKFKGKSESMYGDTVMEIDWSVGEIMKTLKKYGLERDTLIIFTSDNGPWINFGNHAGGVGPLRGAKGNMWEGGPRVPCVMRWPGKIPAGYVCDRMAATIDMLPTLAEITGAPLPENKIDGVSIAGLMKGNRNADPRDHYFYYYGRNLIAVRQGKWKLVFPHTYRSYVGVEPGNDGYPGPYAREETGLVLYDLETDIAETTDISAAHPDIVKRLTELADGIRDALGDKLTGKEGREVRPAGRIDEQ